jgi:hypothetical protein
MPTPAYATTHNGGRGQTNFNTLNDDGCFPFLNHIKQMGTWGYVFPAGAVNPTDLDTDGYPTVINNQGVQNVFFIPPQTSRPGNYIVKWDGNGTIQMGSNFTFVSASAGVTVGGFNNSTWTSAAGNGRVVISNPAQGVVISITGVGSPHITNLRFVHVNDETFLDNGEVFQYDFKNAIREGNFGVLRFLNWNITNLSTQATWGDRKPITYYSYAADEMRSNMFATATWNGSKYIISSPPSSWAGLVDKAHLIITVDTNATGASNLNVNGTGDVPIYNYGGSPISGGNLLQVGKYANIFYDAAAGVWVSVGGDNDHGNVYLGNGVPWELMLQLAAEVGAHPWFNIPHYSLTPMTDLVPSLAAYCIANAPSWMIPHFEASNELFNTFSGFNQTYYANLKASALSYGTGGGQYVAWCGLANSTMGQALATAYSVIKANVKTQTKYRAIGGVQTFGGGMFADGTGVQSERFTSTQYLGGAYGPQSGYLKEAASGWLSHICWANYYNPAFQGTATETTMVSNYAGYAATVDITGNQMVISASEGTIQTNLSVHGQGAQASFIPSGTKISSFISGTTWLLNKSVTSPVVQSGVYGGLDDTIPRAYADSCSGVGGSGFPISTCIQVYNLIKQFALSLGITKGQNYEGGYSPDGTGTQSIDALRFASCQTDKVAKYTAQNFDSLYALNGGGFTFDYPSNFDFSGRIYQPNGIYKKGSDWSVLDDIYQIPRQGQWTAISVYNKGVTTMTVKS